MIFIYLFIYLLTKCRYDDILPIPYQCRIEMEQDAQLSQRDRAAGCVIVFAKSRALELGDNDLRTLSYGLSYNPPENLSNSVKKSKIRAITAFKVIQGHRDRYQSKACMRFPISD